MTATLEETADFVAGSPRHLNDDDDDMMSSKVININPDDDYDADKDYSEIFTHSPSQHSQNKYTDDDPSDHNRSGNSDNPHEPQDGSSGQYDDDEVQPIIIGGYDEPESPGVNPDTSRDFRILDFADMDKVDFTVGEGSDLDTFGSSFQPQIISIQSGAQVPFDESYEKDEDSMKDKDKVMSDGDGPKIEVDKTSCDQTKTTTETDKDSKEAISVSNKLPRRGSQDSQTSSVDRVIILSDDEGDGHSQASTVHSSRCSSRCGSDSNIHLTELQSAIDKSNDPFVKKLMEKEKLTMEEAISVAKEVRKYRHTYNINIDDNWDEDEDDDDTFTKDLDITPLKILDRTKIASSEVIGVKSDLYPTKMTPGVRFERLEGRESPEPVISVVPPQEREPDEITEDELRVYQQLQQAQVSKALKFKYIKKGEVHVRGPKHGRSKTIRELLYHREKGQLPPGNYYSYDDYLVLDEACNSKMETDDILIQKTIPGKESKTQKVEPVVIKTEPMEIKTDTTKVRPVVALKKVEEKSSLVAGSSSTPNAKVQEKMSALNSAALVSNKKNMQEAPPEGGSTIILPDGTTIRMSAQQAFNITSTINVPGQQEEEYEEGEYVEEEWDNNMTCPECGEMFELDKIMAHLELSHWLKNPSCHKCGTCDAWFFNKDDYHTHLSRVVENSGEFIKMDKLYKCSLCNKYFKDSEFFLKHLHRKHTDVDSVGSMKILAEVQERQQWCNHALYPPKQPDSAAMPVAKNKPLASRSVTAMSTFQRLDRTLQKRPEAKTVSRHPDTSMEALETGPPPKTIAPKPDDEDLHLPRPIDLAKVTPSRPIQPKVAAKTGVLKADGQLPEFIQMMVTGSNGTPNVLLVPANIAPTQMSSLLSGQSKILPVSSSEFVSPVVSSSMLPVISTGIRVLQQGALPIMSKSNMRTIQPKAATTSSASASLLKLAKKVVSTSAPTRKVPTILRGKVSSGVKVNPLLKLAPSAANLQNIVSKVLVTPLSNQTAAPASSSKSTSRLINEEGYDIPQFIEYKTKPVTPPRPPKRGRPPTGRKKVPRKKRARGRPHLSSDDDESSKSDEFDNWLTQVSNAADKQEKQIKSDSSDGDDQSQASEDSRKSIDFLGSRITHNFACNLCNEHFLHSKSLLKHMTTKHKQELRETMTDAGTMVYKCPMCMETFDTEAELNFHLITHLEGETRGDEDEEGGKTGEFQCPNCDEKFETEDYLNYHMIKHQLAMEDEDIMM